MRFALSSNGQLHWVTYTRIRTSTRDEIRAAIMMTRFRRTPVDSAEFGGNSFEPVLSLKRCKRSQRRHRICLNTQLPGPCFSRAHNLEFDTCCSWISSRGTRLDCSQRSNSAIAERSQSFRRLASSSLGKEPRKC